MIDRLATLGLATLVSTQAFANVINFDSGSFEANGFQQNISTTIGATAKFSTVAGLGLGGSAAVEVSGDAPANADTTAVYTTPAVVNAGAKTEVSMYFKFQAFNKSGGSPGPTLLQMGLARSTEGKFIGFTDSEIEDAFVTGRINTPGMTADAATVEGLVFQTQTKNEGSSGPSSSTVGNPFSLTSGDWYKFVVGITPEAAAGTFTIDLELYPADASGTLGSLLASASGSVTNIDVYNDDSLYGAFRGFEDRGAGAYDNFSVVVPEPTSLALVVAGTALSSGRRRRCADAA